MTVSYEAKDYSRGRTTVMGVATALILWFHFDIPTQSDTIVGFLKSMGDIGVEMFLLASGVGIYFAVQKYDRYSAFLMSRLKRILPTFLCVAVPWYACQELAGETGSLVNWLKNVTAMGFWLDGDWSCWYVSAILLLYALTPAFLWAWKRWRWMSAAVIVGAWALALTIQHTALIVPLGSRLIFIFRIPSYILGLCLGKAIQEEKVFRIRIPILVGILAVCIFVLMSCFELTPVPIPWVYKYFAYVPVMLTISFLSAKLPENPVLTGLGMISLECYLLFEKIQIRLMSQNWMWALMVWSDWFRPLVALVLTLAAAAGLRWLTGGKRLSIWKLDKANSKQ